MSYFAQDVEQISIQIDCVPSRWGDRVCNRGEVRVAKAGPGSFEAFERTFGKCRRLVIGTGEINLGELLLADPWSPVG